MIRPYIDDDLEAVIDVWYRASIEAHSFLDGDFFNTERRALAEEYLPVSETHVFVVDGRIVGFVSMLGNEVGGLFVAPTFQGRGIGRALLDHAAASRRYLELGVFEDNAIGRRFYDAYGFRTVDRHMNEDTGSPELRLRVDLTER
ncbi:MAG: GNAT family N-acetyltransferase [Actinomycetota bacterium]